jgi:hypothetical protein
MAAGRLKTAAAKSVRGRVKTLGNPHVKLGDAVQTEGFPDDELNGSFQVRRIQHVYASWIGFVSEFEFRTWGGSGTGLSR